MQEKLNTTRSYLLAFLIIGAPLSFAPSIATPALDFPSFRIGLYQIAAALFVALMFYPLSKDMRQLFSSNRIAAYTTMTMAVTTIASFALSGNHARGALLTLSVLFLLLLLLCSWWYVQSQMKQIPERFTKAFLLSGVVVAVLALLQLAWGTLADSGGLLCGNCTSAVFGFPRINLTAAEPLFLASSLLPVLIFSFYQSLRQNRLALLSLYATTLTIGLTFARSGYLAGFVGVSLVAVLVYTHKHILLKRILLSLGLMLSAGLLALVLLVGSATIKHYETTPNITYKTIQSTVEHLTLGVIQLPDKTIAITNSANTDPDDDFEPPGLIEASTEERLGSADLAIEAWQDSPKNLFIGTGLGNLGPYVVDNISSTAPSNLTVYIFYVLLLAEAGLLGLFSFLTLAGDIIVKTIKNASRHSFSIVLLGILASFLVQYFFFGSYINVVHIWLWFGVILGLQTSLAVVSPDNKDKRKA